MNVRILLIALFNSGHFKVTLGEETEEKLYSKFSPPASYKITCHRLIKFLDGGWAKAFVKMSPWLTDYSTKTTTLKSGKPFSEKWENVKKDTFCLRLFFSYNLYIFCGNLQHVDVYFKRRF